MQKFLDKFHFRSELHRAIGVEREFFLTDLSGRVVPGAVAFLRQNQNGNQGNWTDELSACIVEHQTNPHHQMISLKEELIGTMTAGEKMAATAGLRLMVMAIAPEDMPLEVYPKDRYLQLKKQFSQPVLSAACRLGALHYHLGVRDMAEALKVYALLSQKVDYLIELGDQTGGLRMELYERVEPNWRPVFLASAEDLYRLAQKQGFVQNPRNWWQIIRISIHGTVEVRTFCMTKNIEKIIEWGEIIRSIAFP